MVFRSISSCYFVALVLIVTVYDVSCKVYERCELARELKGVHRIPEADLATWVCLARHESEFNTSAVNHVSGDHGLFQISQLFWCSPPGNGHACGLSCDQLKDDNIKDDVVCAKRIYREHARLSGDGFNAWVVYKLHCTREKVAQYIEGCFTVTATQEPDINNEVKWSPTKPTSTVQTSGITLGSSWPPITLGIPTVSWSNLVVSAKPETIPTTRLNINYAVKQTSVQSAFTVSTNRFNINNAVKQVPTKPVFTVPTTRFNVNNVGKQASTKPVFAVPTAHSYFNSAVKPASTKSVFPVPTAHSYFNNAVKLVSAKPVFPVHSGQVNVNNVAKQVSTKPISSLPHRGFRIVNGQVTYY